MVAWRPAFGASLAVTSALSPALLLLGPMQRRSRALLLAVASRRRPCVPPVQRAFTASRCSRSARLRLAAARRRLGFGQHGDAFAADQAGESAYAPGCRRFTACAAVCPACLCCGACALAVRLRLRYASRRGRGMRSDRCHAACCRRGSRCRQPPAAAIATGALPASFRSLPADQAAGLRHLGVRRRLAVNFRQVHAMDAYSLTSSTSRIT